MAPEVYSITSASPGISDDQRGRQRTYLIGMGIRTVCFLGSIPTPNPWRWLLIAGAVLLPYFSVVIASSGRDRSGDAGIEVHSSNQLGPSR